MENKELIIEIKERLDQLLENAPNENSLEDPDLIEFYADAQNLKESISNLQIDKDSKLNCYISNFTLNGKDCRSDKRIMIFEKDNTEARNMLDEAFIHDSEDYITNVTLHKVSPMPYGIDYPNEPQFRILMSDTVLV